MGYSLWIKFPDDQDDTFFSAMNAILDSPQQDSFLHDYIHANIPQKIIDHGQKVGMLDGAPLNALAGQLYGGLDSLPDLMQGIDSTPADE